MNCADVCLSMEADGPTDFYASAMRRAAKPHRCTECVRVIAVAEQYENASGKFDGYFFTEKTCAECVEIRKAFCCGQWVFGELWESIRDQLFSEWNEMIAIDCLAKLTSDGAVAKMRAAYDQYREDHDK
jgi:hypothetical protein